MNILIHIIITLCCICTLSFNLRAQDSLHYYIDLTLKNNPQIQSAILNYQTAIEDIKQQGGWEAPEVTVGILTHPMDIMTGKEVITLDFLQKFEWFGTLATRKNAYSKQAGVAYQQYNQTRCEVIANLETNWHELMATKALIRVVNENIALISQLVTLAQGEMQSTAANSFADILQLQIEQNEQQAGLNNLQQQLNSLSINFNTLLNRTPAMSITTPDSLVADTTIFPTQMDTYYMTQNNPDLLANEQLQEFHSLMIKNTRRNSMPKIGLGLQYKFVDKTKRAEMMGKKNGRDIIMPMITVALPIYRKQFNGAIEKQKLQTQITRNDYQTLLNKIQSQYSQRITERISSYETIEQYEKIIALKKQLLQLYTSEFSAGRRSLTALIDLYREILSYQRQTILLIKAYNINTVYLKQLMGNYSKKLNN